MQRRLPALLAVSGSLAALPAAALELGELRVQSALGQPLRASIAYALAPNEQISAPCVSVRSGPTDSGLPGIGPATLSVANGVIELTGRAFIREPMMATSVLINCPYAPNISREYMLFVDPKAPVYEQTQPLEQSGHKPATGVASSVATTALAAPVARAGAPRVSNSNKRSSAVTKDLHSGDRVQVKPGDNLGVLTQRIADRGIGLWPAAMIVFEANPNAFVDEDPNKLKTGSWLTIPDFAGNSAPVEKLSPMESAENSAAEVPVVDNQIFDDAAETSVTTSDLQPGIATVDDIALIAAPTNIENVVIADTELEGPATTSTSPNVATAAIATETIESGTVSDGVPWLWWLAGSGVALILGLLLFGRRFANRDAAGAIALDEHQPAQATPDHVDVDSEKVEALQEVDFDLTDDSPTQENLALDTHLLIDSGVRTGPEMSVDEDFGFASVASVDIELPFEPEAISDTTNVLSPVRMDEHSILDSEVLPNNDDYDMSVIVDVTKIPRPEDATMRDLHAVVVESNGESLITDNYTISKEVDFEILEQDYEDEMTATQALNLEISKAAAELASQMDIDDKDVATSVLPLASVTELDVTSQLPIRKNAINDNDETGVKETLTEASSNDEITVEMPASAADGDTVDMQLGSGKGR